MGKSLKQVLAGIALLGLANFAQADRIIPNTPLSVGNMVVSETVVPGTGDLAGFQIHRFFAAFAPTDLQGLAGAGGLQSIKLELSSSSPFKYLTGEFASPSFPTNRDVDLTGANADDATYRTATTTGDPALFTGIGTGVFVHDPDFDAFSVQGLQVNHTPAPASDAYNAKTPTTGGVALFTGSTSFRVEGFSQNPVTPTPANPFGGDPQAKTANKGNIGAGALFAMAIVPTGSTVDAIGTIAADKGPTTDFATPEPGTLSLAGIGLTALLARRRRA